MQGTVLTVPDLPIADPQARGLDLSQTWIAQAPWGRWIMVRDPTGGIWVAQGDYPNRRRRPQAPSGSCGTRVAG